VLQLFWQLACEHTLYQIALWMGAPIHVCMMAWMVTCGKQSALDVALGTLLAMPTSTARHERLGSEDEVVMINPLILL